MSSTLTGIIIIALLAVTTALYFLQKRKQRKQNPVNRYSKKKVKRAKSGYTPHKEPSMEFADDGVEMVRKIEKPKPDLVGMVKKARPISMQIDDADAVLGLTEVSVPDEDAYELQHKPDPKKVLAAQDNGIRPEQPEAVTRLPEHIVLHIQAETDRPYMGYELLQSLLAAGMRYGDMKIFHRHEKKIGRGPVLFSLACATEPGSFDLPKMGGFSCTGLVLFMTPKKNKDPLKAFELMLEAADHLITDLGGQVLNERREPLKRQDAIVLGKQLREFQETQFTEDLFA